LREAAGIHVKLDDTTLEFAIRRRLERAATQFAEHPEVADNVHRFKKWMDLVPGLPFPVVLWETQNISYAPLMKALGSSVGPDGGADAAKKALVNALFSLKDALKFHGEWARHAAP
jgi:hypothetical protein